MKLFRIARNPSWLASAKFGLTCGLWLAPTTFLTAVGVPLAEAIDKLLLAVARLLSWVVLSLFMIGAGLTGFLVSTEVNQN